MIGPSSGTSGGMPNREATESSGVRAKRKVFDDLDIDNFCDDSCQNGKKRYHPMESQESNVINGSSSTISTQKPIGSMTYVQDSEFSPMSSEGISSSGSMARLEVLVVDGNWEESNLGTNLTSLTNNHHPNVLNSSILTDMQSLQDDYGHIPYWETVHVSHNSSNLVNNNNNNNNNDNAPEIFMAPNMQPVEDQENGNLSWLLDFKLDSLIEAPEDRCSPFGSKGNQNGTTNVSHRFTTGNGMSNQSASSTASSASTYMHEIRRPYTHGGISTSGSGGLPVHVQNGINSSTLSSSNNYVVNESKSFGAGRYVGPKKPPFTYTELIEHALQERGELTVSAIYQWISEHFPYYKSNDDRWKNSVRHNLSINPHFRKGSKAPHGAGHLWAIANRGETRPRQVTPIGGGTFTRQLAKNGQETSFRKNSGNNLRSQLISQVVTMDEIAAATASIQQHDDNEIINSVTLEHCAEQILSGIKREVEVQYLVPMVIPNNGNHNFNHQNHQNGQTEQHCHLKETDFLNPVSKEVVAEECGLLGEGYLVTDLNPTTLGLNMVEPESILPDNLFSEELSFQFYELTSPSQLQSA